MRVGLLAYLLHSGRGYRDAGVSRYTRQLLNALPSVCPQHEYYVYCGTDAPDFPATRRVDAPVPTGSPLVRIGWEQIGLPWQVRFSRVALLHGTVNVLPLAPTAKTVVTVHDLSFIRLPEHLPRRRAMYLNVAVRASVSRANRIIAVSQHVKQELVNLYGVPEGKVAVVYSGVDSTYRRLDPRRVDAFRRRAMGGRPYILHVGTLQPRKNLAVLIQAYAILRAREPIPHLLALVGARGWMYLELFALVQRLGLQEHVRFLDYVDPQDLPLWYNAADLFAYPSLYEGFGLPVLEAMACGVPTITSASSALEEVGGTAVVTVNPASAEDIQEAMSRVLCSQTLQKGLMLAGLERAAGFTWSKTALETVRVYNEALGGST